jgi:hypothetical protein
MTVEAGTPCSAGYESRLPRGSDAVVLVIDSVRNHYSVLLLDSAKKACYVVDTLFKWSDRDCARVVAGTFPAYARDRLDAVNCTGVITQTGATCGPWSIWIAACFVLDVRGCRSRASRFDASRFRADDVVAFWRGVTRV